jgi:phage/plasmid primase-like uncharacterized protein
VKFNEWLVENREQIESVLLDAAFDFLVDLCHQYDTSKLPQHNLSIKSGWIRLGQARNTKDKDQCFYRTDGIVYSNGTISLPVTFNCFQGGGTPYVFQSHEVLSDLYERHKTGNMAAPVRRHHPPVRITSKGHQDEEEEKRKRLSVERDIALWDTLATTGQSGYLDRKGFGDGQYYLSEEMHCKFFNGGLALLITDIEGNRRGLQRIFNNGAKKTTYGAKLKGGYIHLGAWFSYTDVIHICEGYSTGKTIHLVAIGNAVICTVYAGNLPVVAKTIRDAYPGKQIIIHCDNDQFIENEINPKTGQPKGNVGVTKGILAARAIGIHYTIPNFDGLDLSGRPTDYNDLMLLAGCDEVRKQIWRLRK